MSSGSVGRPFPCSGKCPPPSQLCGKFPRALALGTFPFEPAPLGQAYSASRKIARPPPSGGPSGAPRDGLRLSAQPSLSGLPYGPPCFGLQAAERGPSPLMGVLNGRLTLDGSGLCRLGTAADREAERLAKAPLDAPPPVFARANTGAPRRAAKRPLVWWNKDPPPFVPCQEGLPGAEPPSEQ